MKLIHPLFFIFLFSCSGGKNNKADFYYVIKPAVAAKITRTFNSTEKKEDVPAPPPLPEIFYGHHNFILLAESRVYYHNNYVFHRCKTGGDFAKPPRLFITADSLSEISITGLNDFLKKHMPGSSYNKKSLSANISSVTDTIRNPAFKIIADYFDSKNIKSYGIRRLTEEENYALLSKINTTPYDPVTADFKLGFDGDYSQ